MSGVCVFSAEVVNGNLTGLTVVMLTSMEVAIGLTLNLVVSFFHYLSYNTLSRG